MLPPFYKTADTLYKNTIEIMPDFMKENPKASAFSMAFIGAYTLTKTLQYISKEHMDKLIPEFDKKYLPFLEKTCEYGIPVAFAIYMAKNPDDAKSLLEKHPIYTSGMIGAFLGGVVAANNDLKKRNINEKSLEIEQELNYVYDQTKSDLEIKIKEIKNKINFHKVSYA